MKVEYPVDQLKYKIAQGFGADNTNDPISGGFYELFDNEDTLA
jgi:hypothetical protein